MYLKIAVFSYLALVLVSVIGANVIDYNAYNYYNHVQAVPKQGGLSPSIIFSLLRPSSSSSNKPKVPAESPVAAASSVSTAIASAPQATSSSSSGSGFPGLAAIQSTLQRIPSVQSILDASGITKLTDPVLNSARKRWQRIRTR